MITGDSAMLNIEETAKRLGVSVAAVRELAARGELQSYTIDGELRFKPIEVDALAQRERGVGDTGMP
ncbi:MAG: hypothetical protein KatS3mg057_0180 [Herpetosiphonaceae bacterium]|nr:MAG: hypothetical protein KatS3mg057_0180 [Herpetosiphonaceae bacterium]